VLNAAAGQAGHLRHPQAQAGLSEHAASGGLFIGGANPGIGTAGLDQAQLLSAGFHQFLGHNPAAALGHQRTREHAHRLTRLQGSKERGPCRGATDQLPGVTQRRLLRAGKGVAIHDRSPESRHRLWRVDRFRHGASQTLRQGQGLRERKRLEGLKDQPSGLIQGQAFFGVRLSHRAANRRGDRRSCSKAARVQSSWPDQPL